MAIGGSIEAVNLGGREFPVAADSDSQRKLGGFDNEIEANGNSASARIIKTRTTWMLSDIAVEIDDARGDQEYIEELKNSNAFFTVGITYVSGETYQGTGQVVGEFQSSSQSVTAPLSLAGPGLLTKQ